MNITDLRYESGELKKRVIKAHSQVLGHASKTISSMNEMSYILGQTIEELKEIIKLADANIDYYTQVSQAAKEELSNFSSLVDSIQQSHEDTGKYSIYQGKCIECGMDLYADMSFTEEEPGNFICTECYHKITSMN